jgi:hypothetical protein
MTFRITERKNDNNGLVRVLYMLSDSSLVDAMICERESIASEGNHIRLERWQANDDNESGQWEYL